MKVDINKNEWYPVYCITKTNKATGEDISADLYKRYKQVRKEFDKVQSILEKIYYGIPS